jgi:hypothetical protein
MRISGSRTKANTELVHGQRQDLSPVNFQKPEKRQAFSVDLSNLTTLPDCRRKKGVPIQSELLKIKRFQRLATACATNSTNANWLAAAGTNAAAAG